MIWKDEDYIASGEKLVSPSLNAFGHVSKAFNYASKAFNYASKAFNDAFRAISDESKSV